MRRNYLLAVTFVAFIPPAFLLCESGSGKDSAQAEKVYQVKSEGITPPRIIHRVDPSYDEAGRKAKTNGSVILTLIVTPEGDPKNIRISKSLSPGLDKKSIEAVSKWKFAPGTKDGRPVAVELQVETTFRIY